MLLRTGYLNPITANQPPIQEIKSYAAATKGTTNTANHKHAQSTIAFSIDPRGANKEFNIKLIDTLLDAIAAGNPIPLSVNRKDDKGYITFPNQEDAEKAQMILTNKQKDHIRRRSRYCAYSRTIHSI